LSGALAISSWCSCWSARSSPAHLLPSQYATGCTAGPVGCASDRVYGMGGRSPTWLRTRLPIPSSPNSSVLRTFELSAAIPFRLFLCLCRIRRRNRHLLGALPGSRIYARPGGGLPPGVTPTLGPDATGVGWGFQYALVDKSGKNDLADLRSFQDWHLRYWIQSVDGVAEVATSAGFRSNIRWR